MERLVTDGSHDPGGDGESVRSDQGISESSICPAIRNFYELGH